MKSVNLNEYFEIMGYGKGKKVNVSTFAEITGVSIAYISKLLNNQYMSPNLKKGVAFKKVYDYVLQDGYELISGNIIEIGYNNILKQNDKLKMENEYLKSQLKEKEEIINSLNDIVKLCNKVVILNNK